MAGRQIATERIATESQLEKLRTSSGLNLRLAEAQLHAAKAELKQSQAHFAATSRYASQRGRGASQGKSNTRSQQGQDPGASFCMRESLSAAIAILQMANVDQMVVVAEVYETDIKRVKIGQQAVISGRNFPQGQKRAADRQSDLGCRHGRQAADIPLDPRAAVDNRVVEVKIRDKPTRPRRRFDRPSS